MQHEAIQFIRDFRLGDAPPQEIHQAKRCLLDLIGVAAAGSQLDASRITRAVAVSQFGGDGGGLLFDGRKTSIAGSALANAMTIDAFDAHDGHPLTKGHAGCGSLAALLAFAGDGASLSGEAALGHLVCGYEVAIRAGISLHATTSDYHTTGAWVCIAAAGIGARMLGLDDAATREAIGIAEYYGPRSQMMRCIDHPTMVKDGSGWGAMVGATAAVMAREGFTGAPAISVEGASVAAFWSDIGARWRISEQYFKPYPVCRWAQPAMEAATQLRRDHSFEAADIAAVTVRTFREASKLATAAPAGTDAAQYSLPFPLAALLVKGQVGPAEIEGLGLTDPQVLRLSRATSLIEDERYARLFPAERWAEVVIELTDGMRLASRPAVARGSAENPLSDDEVGAKFRLLMESAGMAGRVGEIEDLVMGLDRAESFAPLVEAVTRPAVRHAGVAR